jgi:hypothetical protein
MPLPGKAKNGSSNHGEPFFFWKDPLPTSPKERRKRKEL